MNKEEHPYISLIKSDDPKLIGLGYRLIMDTLLISTKLGLFRNFDNNIKTKTFTFTDNSEVYDNCEYKYEWDFGDGSPKVFTKDASHIFKPGIYTITYKVTNELGTDMCKQELKVD